MKSVHKKLIAKIRLVLLFASSFGLFLGSFSVHLRHPPHHRRPTLIITQPMMFSKLSLPPLDRLGNEHFLVLRCTIHRDKSCYYKREAELRHQQLARLRPSGNTVSTNEGHLKIDVDY